MAAVEALAAEQVAPCLGQRLQRVLVVLGERGTQIERLELLDRHVDLPPLWRRLVDRFARQELPAVQLTPMADAGSDLGRVQRRLRDLLDGDPGTPMDKLELAADDSFWVVRGLSPDNTARAIAARVRGRGPGQTLVVAERDGIILDNALKRMGLPVAGHRHYSRYRSATQVLRLLLMLLFEPLSPARLLQLLIHPVAPLPRLLRARLAEALADAPGIGGPAWIEALEGGLEQLRVVGRSGEELEVIRDNVGYWLEYERFPREPGAPIERVVERAERCIGWLKLQLGSEANAVWRGVYAIAIGQAEDFVAALQRLAAAGARRISERDLDRLLDEAAGATADVGNAGEAQHVRSVADARSVLEPFEEIIWWDMRPRPLDVRWPWSVTELDYLAGSGVALEEPAVRLGREGRAWLRPVVLASSRLVLVLHDPEEGVHPLWSQIDAAFTGWRCVDLEDDLLARGGRAVTELCGPAVVPLPVRAPAPPQRWWSLGRTIPMREVESYSSLSKLIDQPHQWVLSYAARIRPGRLTEIAAGNLLYGNLAHGLYERFFAAHEDWASLTRTDVQRWARHASAVLLAEEGAVLLRPGHRVERERVLEILEQSLESLLEHLRAAGIRRVRAESFENVRLTNDVALQGHIGLLLERATGSEAVLDAKWGSPKYRRDELEANRHLQLATYGILRRAAGGSWPGEGYFIITLGQILAQHDHVFPTATAVPSVHGTAESLWLAMTHTYAWRARQFDAGLVEVIDDVAEADERSIVPREALQPLDESDRFDDYAWLRGRSAW